MGKYVFVGTHCEIAHEKPPFPQGIKLTKFGQHVEMPDDLAKHVIDQGAHLMPQEDFDKLGFTKDELHRHKDVKTHKQASQEFLNKRHKAWAHFHKPTEPADLPIDNAAPETAE